MMNAKVIGVLTVLLMLGFVVSIVVGQAIVIKNDGPCNMLGSDANGNFVVVVGGTVTTAVTNAKKHMLKCKGEGITNDSGRGQHYSGFGCNTFSGFTTDTHATVSASGVATLDCVVTF